MFQEYESSDRAAWRKLAEDIANVIIEGVADGSVTIGPAPVATVKVSKPSRRRRRGTVEVVPAECLADGRALADEVDGWLSS